MNAASITPAQTREALAQLARDVYLTDEETQVLEQFREILGRMESWETDGDMPHREPLDGLPVFGDRVEILDDNITGKAPCTGHIYWIGKDGAALIMLDEPILLKGVDWESLRYGWRAVRRGEGSR